MHRLEKAAVLCYAMRLGGFDFLMEPTPWCFFNVFGNQKLSVQILSSEPEKKKKEIVMGMDRELYYYCWAPYAEKHVMITTMMAFFFIYDA